MPDPQRRGLAQRLARFVANLVYRDIDLHVPPDASFGGPVLAVSNHFGGLSDGVLLIDSAPRMPRVVARDVIWRVPVVGSIASAVGMIPVHRAADGGSGSNDAMFRSAYDALEDGDLVLIFPEGVTQDVPHMAQVRTGAARIALGARQAGVAGLRIAPIGLHYEDKAGFRTRALVALGEPIELDAWAAGRPVGGPAGADDREAVRDLTALVDARMRRTAPDFADWPTAHALHTAAEVLLTDVDPRPVHRMQYGDLELLAARLNRLPEPDRADLVEHAGAYRSALRAARTSDRSVLRAAGGRPRSWWWLLDLALVVLLAPFALAGLLAAAVPLLLVLLASKLPVAPAVRATAVPGIALLSFLGVWGLFGWQSLRADGWGFGVLAVLLFPFLVGALFVVVERAQLIWRGLRTARRPSGDELARLQGLRAEVARRAWAGVSA